MFSSPYFDTIICMMLVYALLGILVSILLEIWNQFIKQRGAFLQKTIFRLLDDPLNLNLGYLIYQHPAINRQRKDGNSYPYYISAETFSNALIDTIAEQDEEIRFKLNGEGKYEKVKADNHKPLGQKFKDAVHKMKDSDMKMLFIGIIDRSITNETTDYVKLRAEISQWYNDYMDRVSGEYKTLNRPKLLFLGLFVAFTLNVDTLHLAQTFYQNKGLRDSVMSDAQQVAEIYNEQGSATENERYDKILTYLAASDKGQSDLDSVFLNKIWIEMQKSDSIDSLQKLRMNQVFATFSRWEIPLGYNRKDAPLSWFSSDSTSIRGLGINPVQNASIEYHERRNNFSPASFLKWFVGLLITGIALGFGAPFWFEILVKFINIRNAGAKPVKAIAKNISSNS
jgi:hypothetical protein